MRSRGNRRGRPAPMGGQVDGKPDPRPSPLLPLMTHRAQLLNALEPGDPHAAAQLLPLVYDDLRRLAAHRLAHEAPGQTLQPTDLVHEAYLRLVTPPPSPPSKGG